MQTRNLWSRFDKWAQSWDKRHPKAAFWLTWISIAIISLAIASVISVWSIPFGFITVLSADALKTLIEAEATILGFFGLLVVYALTSYDNRIDKLEERIDECRNPTNRILLLSDYIKIRGAYEDRQRNIKKRKEKVTTAMLVSLGSLVFSFFLSITAYGILTTSGDATQTSRIAIAFPLSFIASILLFVGILSIFVILFRMGKEPE